MRFQVFLKPRFTLGYILFIALFLISCTDSGNDTSDIGKIYYSYGSDTPPGVLTPLDSSYKPLHLSTKVFTNSGSTYSPMNLESQLLNLTLDAVAQTTRGQSFIHFKMSQNARPLFHLSGTITSAKLNGLNVTVSAISDPDNQGQTYWAVNQDLTSGSENDLEIEYTLPADRVSFTGGGARLLTDMTDLYSARFFELWGPTGFEDDAFEMNVRVKIENSASTHRIFANGDVTDLGSNHWEIAFPKYFTTSSLYLHVTNNSSIKTRQFVYQGLEKDIPVIVYSTQTSLVDRASAVLPELFQEFERDFGSYPHESFIAHIHSGGGGMEYSGATITGMSALDHELFHSWFARSVMPAEGRSGWIDEAFASWRDYGYFQAPSLLSRIPTRLASFSPFRKSTPENCYRDGRHLIAELDRVLATFGGMKPMMKLFFERYKNRVITNEEFWSFLNQTTQMNLDEYFQRYTLAGAEFNLSLESLNFGLSLEIFNPLLGPEKQSQDSSKKDSQPFSIEVNKSIPDSKHPHPLTKQELELIR